MTTTALPPVRSVVGGLCTAAAAMTAAMAVASAAATIVAGDVVGARWAGLPATAGIVGTGAGALLLPGVIGRLGRRRGLLAGYALALAGAALAGVAVVAHRPGLTGLALPLGLLLLGAGNAAAQLTRYLAGDLFAADRRGRAIALVVLGSTVGAVAGPLLLRWARRFADLLGADPRSGPFVLAGLAVAVALMATTPVGAGAGHAAPRVEVRALLRDPAARAPLVAMAGAQMVMVAVMTAAPLEMHRHGSGLGPIGVVLSAHTLGMFAPAPVSGRLADRHGGAPVMLAGLCVAAVASAFAAGAGSVGDAPHGVIYFGLGVAWNLAFVGGSTALSRGADADRRLAVEGAVDAVVWSLAAVAGAGSTVLLAAGGFPLLGGAAAAVAIAAAAGVAGNRSVPPTRPLRSDASPAASRPGC